MEYSYVHGATTRDDQYEFPFRLNDEVGKYIVKQ